jgi:hypothetical protein
MKCLTKILTLSSMVFTTLYNTLMFADTVNIQFRHVSASEKPNGSNPLLCVELLKPGHSTGTGFDCFEAAGSGMYFAALGNAATFVDGIPQGEMLHGYVTTGTGLTSVFGEYHLVSICHKDKDFTHKKEMKISLYLKKGDIGMDIDIACPVDAQGNLLQPQVRSAVRK